MYYNYGISLHGLSKRTASDIKQELIIIIILKNNQFSALKKDKLVKINFIIKLKEKLNLIILLLFNRCILFLNKDFIALY